MWPILSHKNQLNTCTIPLGSFLAGCLLLRTLPDYLTCQCLKEYPQSPTYCHWHTADTMLWSCTRMLAMMSVYFGKDWEFSDAATVLQTREMETLKTSSVKDGMHHPTLQWSHNTVIHTITLLGPYAVASSILIQILTISNMTFNVATLLCNKLGSTFEFGITGVPTRGNGSTNHP